jgi:hypothetical protein
MILSRVVPTSGLLNYRSNIIEKMVPEDLQKDRRDIDEFGNEIKTKTKKTIV